MQTYFVEKYINPFSQSQYQSYESSLKYYRDLKNSMDAKFDEGFDKGVYAEKQRMTKELKAMNADIAMIVQLTGLSINDIEKL